MASSAPGLQRNFWIRTTGFPFQWLEPYRCAGAAAAASRTAGLERATAELERTLSGEIAARFPLGNDKLQKAIARRAPLGAGALPSAEAWNRQVAAQAESRLELDALIGGEFAATRDRLAARLGDERLREAIFLSSRQALSMLDHLRAEKDEKRTSKTRYREVEGFLFLQRLCAKNETVSFFGPLGWGRFGDHDETRLSSPSDRFRRRMVAFEYWASHALASAVSADPELADDLPVRLNPSCRIDGDTLHYPIAHTRVLEPTTRRVAAAAHGQPHRELVRVLGDEGLAPDVVRSELAVLFSIKVLERGLFVPTQLVPAEEQLRAQVAALSPSPGRDRWLGALDELLGMRVRYAAAPFEERQQLLAALDERFQSLTGKDATRGEGQVYTGRALVYEDCQLDVELVLGRTAKARIEEALAPTLSICRWVVRDIAGGVQQRYREIFAGFGQPEVDLLAFARAARVIEEDSAIIDATRARLQAAWQEVLGAGDETAVERTLEDGDFARVLERLPPPRASGPFFGEQIHSPDVILAASSPDALRSGDFEVVLGEIHKMVHYEAHPVGWPFCPDQADVLARLTALLPPSLLRLMDAPGAHHSRGYCLPSGTVVDVVPPGTAARIPEKAHPIGEIVVFERDETLEVRHVRSSLQAPLLSFMQNLLYRWSDEVAPMPVPQKPYLPRLRYRGAVLRRRIWRLETADLADVCRAASPAEALLAAARLRLALGAPRCLFAKSPEEPKPIYVDLESPLSVELMIKLARKAPWLRVSEMYPAGDRLWLERGGRAHTSELRFTWVLA